MKPGRDELYIAKDFSAFRRSAAQYYSLGKIKQRLQFLQNLRAEKVRFLFPIKSFPHPKILQLASEHLDGFDVSNQAEVDLVKAAGCHSSTFWLSSPYFDHNLPAENFNFMDVNSTFQLKKLKRVEKTSLRISSDFIRGDSRFGIPNERAEDILKKNPEIKALHIHLGTQENTVSDYMEIIGFFKRVTRGREPFHLNFGGGFGCLSEQEVESIITEAQKSLPSHTLYFEPGRWISAPGGYAAGKILCVDGDRITTTLSSSCHLRWAEPSLQVLFPKQKSGQDSLSKPVKLCGPTCFEGDVLAEVELDNSGLSEGDTFIIKPISGYSYAWNHSFNGVPEAEVVFFE